VDSRPFGQERGFYRLGRDTSLENVSRTQIEALPKKFLSGVAIDPGDVYAVLLENFYDKTVMVMKIESYDPGRSVRLSFRYLARAKTAFSDDKE
jgi:hypothetical protein